MLESKKETTNRNQNKIGEKKIGTCRKNYGREKKRTISGIDERCSSLDFSGRERERVTAKMERTMEEKIFIESESERPPCFAAAKGILGRERERETGTALFFFFFSILLDDHSWTDSFQWALNGLILLT